MLSNPQQDQFIAFVGNFVALLAETDMTREQARDVAAMAASTLLGAVLRVDPNDQASERFVTSVLKAAVKKFYGEKDLQA